MPLIKLHPVIPGANTIADTIEIIINENNKTGAFLLDDCSEIYDVNDGAQLAGASENHEKKNRQPPYGRRCFLSPPIPRISAPVQIGRDTVLCPTLYNRRKQK